MEKKVHKATNFNTDNNADVSVFKARISSCCDFKLDQSLTRLYMIGAVVLKKQTILIFISLRSKEMLFLQAPPMAGDSGIVLYKLVIILYSLKK